MNDYFELNKILNLDLDDKIKESIKEKFGKKVFFELDGSCKIGKLVGVSVLYGPTKHYYYIIKDSKLMPIPIWKEINLL